MVEAMVYILRTGCPWRDIPSHFGPWSSVYTRWSRWAQAGLWAALLDILAQHGEGALRHLDSTHVKVHQDAANPAGGQQNQCLGRTKGGLNCKVSALVDAKGRALQLTLPPGQRNDMIAAEEIVFPNKKRVVADKGYDGDRFRQRISMRGAHLASRPAQTDAIQRATIGAITNGDIAWRISFSASRDRAAWARVMKNWMSLSSHFCVWQPSWTGLTQFEDTP